MSYTGPFEKNEFIRDAKSRVFDRCTIAKEYASKYFSYTTQLIIYQQLCTSWDINEANSNYDESKGEESVWELIQITNRIIQSQSVYVCLKNTKRCQNR